MFEFLHAQTNKRILMTGDGNGTDLKTNYGSTLPAVFDIIKVDLFLSHLWIQLTHGSERLSEL